MKDVLALQSRVAQEIASEIQARMAPAATDGALSVNDSLQPASPAKSTTRGPVNAEGYDAYLRGKAMTDGGQMLDAAEEHLKKAIELNPRYAAPYITLAMYYQTQASWEFAPSKSTYAKAKNAALKAIELEPDSGAAHRELGWVYWRGDWNFAAADKEYQTALKLDSGSAATHEQYALFLKSTGRYDDALREINRCLELSPMQSISHANAGTILGLTHQYDSAQGQFSRALELDPRAEYVYRRMGAVLLWQSKNDQALKVFQKAVDTSGGRPEDLAWLAYGYAVSGMRDASSDVLNQILRQSETQHVSPFYVAMVYAGLGDKDQAFTWLENAFNSHDEWMVYLKIYPEFASLSNDPRFADLARRVGLH